MSKTSSCLVPAFRAAWTVILLLGGAATIRGGAVDIRFVAADHEGTPPVSNVVDFRRAPDGGLIAVQWVSGATLGKATLFPVVNIGNLAPDAPELKTGRDKLKDDADDLLKDIKKKTAKDGKLAARPVDAIDPLYQGKTLGDGRKVGRQRARQSVAVVDLPMEAVIEPGAVAVSPRDSKVDVPCYAVTITAVVEGNEGQHVAFTPQLTWKDRDLLGDCLFEHSPDLPLGDTSVKGANLGSLLGLMQATRGGDRPFRKLTFYLPVTGRDSAPYVLNGHPFTVTAAGVNLKDGPARVTRLRHKDKFALELLLPAPTKVDSDAVPVLTDLAPVWKTDLGEIVEVPAGSDAIAVTLRPTTGDAVVLRPRLKRSTGHAHLLIGAGGRPDDEPVARVVILPRAVDTAEGRLKIRLAAADRHGPAPTPKSIAATLSPWSFTEVPRARKVPLSLVGTEDGDFTTPLADIEPGMYALRLDLPGTASIAVPLVIADRRSVGSATLCTYHNRCDYQQGEQVQAGVIVRALADVGNTEAKLTLRHETGESIQLGTVALSCPRNEARSRFITFPTASLRLGRYELSLAAPGLIAYPLHFTVHSAVPKTSFALYSWMVGSFSGPVRVGGETVINLLLDQKPTSFLSPQELARYTDQGTMPAQFRASLLRDPLYPAAERTETYDAATERELAAAMRMGLRFAPGYGWGLNSQEASWNPKHTLPEDLARVRRLCSLVTQRHRDFANFAGLHLNWYPSFGGYWENHPPTDGHAERRNAQLQKEVEQLRIDNGDDWELARRRHLYRVGALPRAYDAWTELARRLPVGLSDEPVSGDPYLVGQPGLMPGRPVYTSFLPIGWFDQQRYYPPAYFATLPVATVHAYTDYGFAPFQPLWGLDFWAAGMSGKPRWVTTMSNGRDIMMGQALLAVGRGAHGVDINGDDPACARVLSRFLGSYGPFFRTLEPGSDVAIVTSRTQQMATAKLVGRWMGYSGGSYFDLYTKLWYARRPPAVLLEEELAPERLQKFQALFLVGQQVRLPDPAMRALADYAKAGGLIFKDKATSADYPGTVIELAATEPGKDRPAWELNQYQATRDRMFVATQAGYEEVARSLDKLLAPLPPPRVTSDSHKTLVATLVGKDVSVAFAVNDSHVPPGIQHPWNFWSATILASEAKLRFDHPYVLYDLLAGGKEIRLQRDAEGRCETPVRFDRSAGRVFVLMRAGIREVKLSLSERAVAGDITIAAEVIDENGRSVRDPLPFEIAVLDEAGREVETLYRALGPGLSLRVRVPTPAQAVTWRVRARELVSGRTVEGKVALGTAPAAEFAVARVLVPRPAEVVQFLSGRDVNRKADARPCVILLERAQGDGVLKLAEKLADAVRQRGGIGRVMSVDDLEVIDWPQRWQPTVLDRRYLAEAQSGKRVLVASPLATRYGIGEKNRDHPDYLHPESGYGEPAARHRIFDDVILLGTPKTNRFLADLHETVGMRVSAQFPAAQSALVQVIFDAFVPGYHALSIQAPDLAGLEAGIDAALSLKPRPNSPQQPKVAMVTVASDRQTPLPNVSAGLAAAVQAQAFTSDGGILASAGLQSANYFLFDASGKLRKKWLGMYALLPSHSGKFLWTSHWWGAPGLLDKIVCCDADARPLWLMDLPPRGGRFQHWHYPGAQTLPARDSDDLFVAGHRHLLRISPAGKTLWRCDDTPTANDVHSFRFSRDLMLHSVSADGRFVLAAAFGVQPYSNFVSRFVRPAVLLFDAHTGKVLWEKPDLLIDHSACAFAGKDRIVIADATPGRKRLLLLDMSGKEVWSLARPEGTSAAELTGDGKRLIVRPEAARGPLHQVIGEPQGLQAIDLETKTTRAFPLSGTVSSWKVLPESDQVLVSTADGWLRCFESDGKRAWEQRFNGACSIAVAGDGRIALGTPDGKLRQVDRAGRTIVETDLMPHNMIADLATYVRDYTRTPGAVPTYDPAPALPPTINERGRGVVEFSRNLADAQAVKKIVAAPVKGPVTFTVDLAGGRPHVLSVVQRVSGNRAVRPGEALRVEVRSGKDAKPLMAAQLPLSATWQERTVAWKSPPADGRFEVTLSPENGDVDLSSLAVFALTYPSRNLLAQRIPDAPGADSKIERKDDLLGKGKAVVSEVRYHIPNDVDLTAQARGAPAFRAVMEYTTPFDGLLTGQNTSWLGKPLGGSTHATLEISFKEPVKLGALAVYEDATSPRHYTDTFALFLRQKKTGHWVQVGSVVGNRSPFNLFTFPAIEADAATYLWLKSSDGHARIAELEAYLSDKELLD